VALAGDMFVALVTDHIHHGFFAADGGIELVLLLGGASAVLALTGAGASAPTTS
jgi:putative oxidoreductase